MPEELLPGGLLMKTDSEVFKPGIDSMLLAYFAYSAAAKKSTRAIDIGCGTGIISLLLAWHLPKLHIESIDINYRAAELTAENARINNLSERIKVTACDLRLHREIFNAGVFDFSLANPPFYRRDSGKRSSDAQIATARSEMTCTLLDVCRAAAYLTRTGGPFFLVHKPERLSEIFSSLQDCGFKPKYLRFVQHSSSSPPFLVLIESRRAGKASLLVDKPFILTQTDGSDTDELRAVYTKW